MINLDPDRIIPITVARSRLDDLVSQAKGSTVFAISRQGKTQTAIIDLKYLQSMAEELRKYRMQAVKNSLQAAFSAHLEKKGISKDKLDDKEVDRLVAGLS